MADAVAPEEQASIQELLSAYGVTWEEYQSFVQAKEAVDAGEQGYHPKWGLMMELHEDITGDTALSEEAAVTVEEETRGLDDIQAELKTAAPGSEEYNRLVQEGRGLAVGDEQASLTLENLIAQTQGTDPRLQGVFNAAGMRYDLAGQGTDDGALWYGMWQYAANFYGVTDLPDALALNPEDVPEGSTWEQWAGTRFQSWLSSNPEGAEQQTMVRMYAEDNGLKAPRSTMGESDTETATVMELANRTGVSTRKMAKIIDMGNERGMSPTESATLWRFAVNQGLVDDDPSSDNIGRPIDTSIDPREYFGNIFGELFGAVGEAGVDLGVDLVGGDEAAQGLMDAGLANLDERPDWLQEYERLGADPGHRTMVSSNQLFGQYEANVEELGTELPALVSLIDPEMGRRLVADPYSLTTAERKGIYDMVADDPELSSMMQSSFLGSQQLAWLQGMGGGGESLVKVDKESVRDATRTLLSSWNLPGMSDDFVDSVANSFAAGQKVAAQNAIGNPFNPEWQGAFGPTQRVVDNPIDKAAHAKKAIRGTAEYQKYFANKGNLSEEEYVGRFEAEANRMLGYDSDESTRAAMLSGDRSDVGQHAIASGEFKESSTFQGRLARLADAFRSET